MGSEQTEDGEVVPGTIRKIKGRALRGKLTEGLCTVGRLEVNKAQFRGLWMRGRKPK